VRILYIRPRFQPEIHSTSESSRRHIYKNHSSRHQESQQQYQEEPVRSLHIKTEDSSVSGVNCRRPQKGVGLSVTVQEGVTTSSDTLTSRHRTRHGVLPCRLLTSILHGPDECSGRTSHSHHPLPQLTRPCCPLPEFHPRAGALCIPLEPSAGSRPQQRDQAKLPEHIITKRLNIICVLL